MDFGRARGRLVVVAALSFIAGCSGPAQKAGPSTAAEENLPDVDYRRQDTLHLTRAGGRWSLTTNTRVSIKYRTRRATRTVTHSVYEPFFARVEDLEAQKDGSSLSSDQIERVTVQRPGVLFDDDHRHLLKFKSVEVGQTLTWSYKQTYDDIGWAPQIMVPNLDRIARYEIEVNHPPGVQVDFKVFYPRQRLRPAVARGPRRSSITFTDLPHPRPLSHFGYNDLHAVIWPQARKGAQEITPASPRGYISWHRRRLRLKPEAPLRAADRALLERTVGTAAEPREKLKRVYDWVRKNVRYVADARGLHGNVPHAPSYVLKKRFGDCKDLSNLVIKLAAAAGTATVPVFVAVKPLPRFEGVNDRMFDHMIGAYRDGDRWLFFDPVCDHCPFGNLPEMDIDKPAFVVFGEQGELLTIPAPPQHPSTEVQLEARLDALDRAAATVILRNERLSQALEIRRLPAAKQRVLLSRLLSKDLYKILLEELKIEAVADDHVRLSARADLSEFLVRTERRVYVPMVAIRALSGQVLDRKADSFPILVDWRDNVLLRLKLSAPGYTARAAAPLQLGSEATATVSSSLVAQGDTFTAEYRFWQRRKHFEGEQRQPLLDLCTTYLRSRKRMFMLERRPGEQAPPAERSAK